MMPKVTGTVRSKNPLKGAVEVLPVSQIGCCLLACLLQMVCFFGRAGQTTFLLYHIRFADTESLHLDSFMDALIVAFRISNKMKGTSVLRGLIQTTTQS